VVLPSTSPRASAAAIWSTVIAWCALDALGTVQNPDDCERAATELFDILHLRGPMAEMFESAGLKGEERWRAAARVRAAFADISWAPLEPKPLPRRTAGAPLSWVHDPDVAWLIGVHEYEGVRYFNKELFERLLWWMALRPLLAAASPSAEPEDIRQIEQRLQARIRAAVEGGYRVEVLLEPTSL
jgi:hypothetical protein